MPKKAAMTDSQPSRFPNTQRGFTLVELSIVLVIIGLLIGGILVAKSMINTARIGAQIRQLQQLDAAVSNFQTRFAQLPGDSDKFPNPGDNDGKISRDADPSNSAISFANEIRFFWKHLQQGVQIFPDYTFDTTLNCSGDGNCDVIPHSLNLPPAAMDNSLGIMVGYDAFFMAVNYNLYAIGKYDNGNSVEDLQPTIACYNAISLDTKLDDGVSSTGNVTTDPNCSASIDNLTSFIYVKLLSQTGQSSD